MDYYDNANSVIEVEVHNVGFGIMGNKKKHVGKGSINLKTAVPGGGKHYPVVIDLFYNEGKKGPQQQGKAKIRCFIEGFPARPQQPAPAAAPAATQPAAAPAKAEQPAVAPVATPAATQPAPAAASVKAEPPKAEQPKVEQPPAQPATAPPAKDEQPKPAEKPVAAATPVDTSKKEDPIPPKEGRKSQITVNKAPLDDKSLKLTLNNMRAHELRDTGSTFDKQDPKLVVTIGKQSFATARQKDAGVNATFPEVFEFSIPAIDYEQNALKMIVEVKNEGLGWTKEVGEGSISLLETLPEFKNMTTIRIDLSSKGQAQGYITMTANLVGADDLMAAIDSRRKKTLPALEPSPPSEPPAKGGAKRPTVIATDTAPTANSTKVDKPTEATAAPASSVKSNPAQRYLFQVDSISVNNVRNVELMPGDKNDLYIKASFGNIWKVQTPPQDGAGAAATWPFPAKKEIFYVNEQELMSNLVNIEVWDKNSMRSDTLIAKCETSFPFPWLDEIKSNKTLQKEFSVMLNDKNKTDTEAKLKFTITHEEASIPAPTAVKEAPSNKTAKEEDSTSKKAAREKFTKGMLRVKKVTVQNLPNVERIMGQNDLYVTMKYAGQDFQTETKNEAGAGATFDFLDFKQAVDLDSLQFEAFQCQVYDRNDQFSNRMIGQAKVESLQFLLQHVNEDFVEVPLTLMDETGKKKVGNAILFMQLTPENSEEDEAKLKELLKSFTSGELQIHRIRMFDIPNMKQHKVILKLQYGEWNVATSELDLSKVSPIYEHLDYHIPVTAATLSSTRVTIEVHFKGMIMGTSMVASGTVSMDTMLLKLNADSEVTMDLQQKKASTGRIVIQGKLLDQKTLDKLNAAKNKPKTIDPLLVDLGTLRIASIMGNAIKNTELWGNQDPYVCLEYGASWKKQTPAVSAQGGDVLWDNVDYALEVKRTDLESMENKAFQIKVSVYDDNTVNSDTLVGVGYLDIRDVAIAINTKHVIEVNVMDKKNTRTGRITFNCELTPTVKEEAIVIPANLSQVFCRITKVYWKNEGRNSLLGSKDATVKVSFGAWKSDIGPILYNPNSELLLEHQTIESEDFDVQLLKSTILQVSVMEGKKELAVGELKTILPTVLTPGHETVMVLDLVSTNPKKTPMGRLALNIILFPNTEKKLSKSAITEELADEFLNQQPAFQDGILNIASIKLTNLKNVELFGGKIDPFVIVNFGDWSSQTPVLENAGVEVMYPGLQWTLLVHSSQFYSNAGNAAPATTDNTAIPESNIPLQLMVYDKNHILANKFIGTCTISLKRLAFTINKEIEVHGDLLNDKKKVMGKVVVALETIPLDDKNASKYLLPKDFQEGLLHITTISAFDLLNREAVGKQDPYVNVTIPGLKYDDKTAILADAGSNAIFKELDLKCIVKRADIEKESLSIKVMESNNILDLLIGQQKISLRHYVNEVNQEIQIPLTLYSSNKDITGRILVVVKLLSPIPEEYLQELAEKNGELAIVGKLPPLFKRGEFVINRIVAHKLLNTEWFTLLGDKQDLYIEFYMLDWKTNTEVKNNAGTDCIWDILDLATPITIDQLKTASLKAVVKNKNTSGDVVVGEGEVSLTTAFFREVKQEVEVDTVVPSAASSKAVLPTAAGTGAATPSTVSEKKSSKSTPAPAAVPDASSADPMYEATITIKLSNPKSKKKPSGKLVLTVCLEPEEKDQLYDNIPASFEYGLFKISQIEAFRLANREFFGKQDPFVKVKFCDYQDQTVVKNDISSNMAAWQHLSMNTGVYREQVESNVQTFGHQKGHVEVEVYESNTSGNILLGKTLINLNKAIAFLGRETVHKLILNDPKTNKMSGKLKITCGIFPDIVEDKIVIPADLSHGMLRIKRIAVNNVKLTEGLLGMDKIDPYVLICQEEIGYEEKTHVLENIPDNNIIWDSLDKTMLLDRKAISVGKVKCFVMDKNKHNQDRLIGVGIVSIKRFVSKLEKEYECTCDLLEVKAKDAVPGTKVVGQLNFCGMLTKHIPLTASTVPTSADPTKTAKVTVLEAANATNTSLADTLFKDFPPDFSTGLVEITSIQAESLQNKEMSLFGGAKQDPYLKLVVSDYFQETVPTLNNAGSNPIWTDLNIQFDVNKEQLLQEQLDILVYDENFSRKDVSLGKSSLSLKKLCGKLNKPTKYTMDLIDNNNALCGKVIVNLTFFTKPDANKRKDKDPSEGLPESAVTVEKGMLRITEIIGYDLKGGESFLDKADPYVEVLIPNVWKNQTKPLNNAGGNPKWTLISDLQVPITKEILTFSKLQFQVKDKNKYSGDEVMSRGEISLRRLGSLPLQTDDKYTIKVKEPKRGLAAGRLEIHLCIDPLPVSTEEDTSGGAADSANKTVGKIQFQYVQVNELKAPMLMKYDIYAKIAIGKVWNTTLPVNKAVSTDTKWVLREETKEFAAGHFTSKGLVVQIWSKGTVSDTMLGEASIPLHALVGSVNQWLELKEMITKDGICSGRVYINCRFATNVQLLEEFKKTPIPEASSEGNGVALLQNAQDQLNKKVGKMEASLRDHFHKELEHERKLMMDAMESQNADLKKALEKLMKKLAHQEKQQPVAPDQLAPPVQAIQDLQLPKDIAKWRTAHVQAWLAFEMELPQYLEPFTVASIDGLVLLEHVTLPVLHQDLQIADHLHCTKILNGVTILKRKYAKYKAAMEEERLRRLKKKQDEEAEAERKRLEALEKNKPKKKKKKSKSTPATFFGDVKESNMLERVKLTRTMQALHQDMKKRKDQHQSKHKTWHFEYTGEAKPTAKETIWDHLLAGGDQDLNPSVGTETYQKTMSRKIAKSLLPGVQTEVRTIPKNCSTDEVLAVIKGAMFEVSTWLVEIERLNYTKQALLDGDLMEDNLHFHDYDDADADAADEEGLDEEAMDEVEEDDDNLPSVAPPDYDDVLETEAPPTYEEVIEGMHFSPTKPLQPRPSTYSSKKVRSLREALHHNNPAELLIAPPEVDRMSLIYKAMINQQNNDARWLGSNSKLTRLKLEGGITSLLKLKLDWSQFDTMWTRLDYKRTGDIDLNEFKAFFGDLSEFESQEGMATMTFGGTHTGGVGGSLGNTTHQQVIGVLTKALYDLCDILRHAGFTIIEMFSGFDRNGSGEISISEFCSMLRTVLGQQSDKRVIYRALNVLDTDGNKAISLQETLHFVYRIWKTQLDELADKLYKLDDVEDKVLVKKILDERQAIKLAIKKNFPRAWRDRLEREGGHNIPGPFAALLQRMNVNQQHTAPLSPDANERSAGQPHLSQSWSKNTFPYSGVDTAVELDSPTRHHPQETRESAYPTSPRQRPASAGATAGLHSPSKSGRNYKAGHNQLLRLKVKLPAHETVPSSRLGSTLTTPQKKQNLTASIRFSGEVTGKVLSSQEHFSGL